MFLKINHEYYNTNLIQSIKDYRPNTDCYFIYVYLINSNDPITYSKSKDKEIHEERLKALINALNEIK